jgi:hypothetical protein
MARSEKTAIIEAIFNERYDPQSGTLSDPVVRLDDLRRYKQTGNLYAFFKDIVRKTASANRIWPESVLRRGYTGVQEVGQESPFRFIPLPPAQTVAFRTGATLVPNPGTPRHRIESASLPLASRQLGRSDEPWLIQVAVRLRVIETHLALASPRKIVSVDHLQMSVKLNKSEVDALFLATEHQADGTQRELLISCEAKSLRDDIVEEQVIRQVQALARQRTLRQAFILPTAIKAVAPSELFFIEFDLVAKAAAAAIKSLVPVSSALYKLVPPVPGIGE